MKASCSTLASRGTFKTFAAGRSTAVDALPTPDIYDILRILKSDFSGNLNFYIQLGNSISIALRYLKNFKTRDTEQYLFKDLNNSGLNL